MYTIKTIVESATSVSCEINGKWVPCRPEQWWGLYGFWLRTKDAYAVITGKADAVIWPEGQ